MLAAYILLGGLTLAVCLSATPLGRVLGVIDAPDGRRKIHDRPTPLVGGLAIMLAVLTMTAVQALATDFDRLFGAMVAGVVAFLVLGLIDDRAHIRPFWRLIISFVLCLALLAAVPGLQVSFLEFSFLPVVLFLDGWPGLVFTLLCLVGLQNAVNMADGRNGLVIGMTLVWTGILFVYAPAQLYPLLMTLALTLAITLVFNLRGRLFLGDSGTYSLSMGVALIAIYCYQVNFAVLSADRVALLFLIPVVDCLRLMAVRVFKGRSPFTSDSNHLHHILTRLMPWSRALPTYLALVGVPNLLAVAWPTLTLLWGVLAVVCYGTLVALGRVSRAQLAERRSAA